MKRHMMKLTTAPDMNSAYLEVPDIHFNEALSTCTVQREHVARAPEKYKKKYDSKEDDSSVI